MSDGRSGWLGVAAMLGALGCVDVPPRTDPMQIPAHDMQGGAPDQDLLDGSPPDGALADSAALDALALDGMLADGMPSDGAIIDGMPSDDIEAGPPLVDAGDAAAPEIECLDDETPLARLGVCLRFTELDEMPAPRLGHLMGRAPDGTLVVVGGPDLIDAGSLGLTPTYILPADAEMWIPGTPPTHAHTRGTLSAIPGQGLYLAGGAGADAPRALGSVESFVGDIVSWEEDPRPMAARERHAAVVWDDGILLVGGRDDAGPLGTIERWPEARDFRPIPPLPAAREAPLAAVLDGQLVVLGGDVGGEAVLDPIIWRGPDAERWEALPPGDPPLPITTGAALASDGHALVLAGGARADGGAGSDRAFIFTDANGWQPLRPMANRRQNHTVTPIGDGLFAIIGSSPVVEIVRADPPLLVRVDPPMGFAGGRERHAAAAGERSVTISGGINNGTARDDVWRISQRPAD